MKKFSKILLLSVLSIFLVAGSAMAISMDYYTGIPADIIYNDTGADYVGLTDLTTPASAPMFELSSTILGTYNHDYIIGLFDYDGTTINELDVLDTFQSVTSSNVLFDLVTGITTSAIDTGTIDPTYFGFFIRFYDGIQTGNLTSEVYYSDSSIGMDVFSIFYDPAGLASANWAEVALGVGGPSTQGHAFVAVHDVNPVHEPATMLLLGTGLIGLAGMGRRKFFKKS